MRLPKLVNKNSIKFRCLIAFVVIQFGCKPSIERAIFGEDLVFLSKKTTPIILKDGENRQVIVSAAYQGKVMASTSRGLNGYSYGWFNKGIISSDTVNFNRSKVGGAGRIWFGPDQGPNTIFFKKNKKTNKVEHAAPKDLDTMPFNVLKRTESSVVLGNKLHLENLKGFHFYIDVKRQIDMLSKGDVETVFNLRLDKNIDFVAFQSETTMQNIGSEDWTKEQGLLSLWDLGCFYPTPKTTVIIPLKGDNKKATVYFTEIDSTRIVIKDNTLFYKADANYLNKIGTLPEHTLPYFGSYSPELNLLTVIKFSLNDGFDYVNAHPENIKHQYRGDVINVFNDGVIGDIGPFGPFYELETSSASKALKIGDSIKHKHMTYHFEGDKTALNTISKSIFNISLDNIETALP